MASRKPRRGPAGRNVLITGDTGTTAGGLGGARPGPSEAGSLKSREYGVPQADIPGGVRHAVNPEARPASTEDKALRPADYHKYHGVPPIDDGEYRTPPTGVGKAPRPEPEPRETDAVPVYMLEAPGSKRKIRTMTTIGPLTIPANDAVPRRVCDRDPNRVTLFIMNENGTRATNLRVGLREDCDQGNGYFLGGASGSGFEIKGVQDEIYVWNDNTSSLTWSALIITEIEASGA